MKDHGEYLKNVEVGDRLWSVEYGWGIVSRILTGVLTYPIEVNFNDTRVYYTVYGKRFFHVSPTLFFHEVEIPESAFIRKNPSSFREFLENNGICFDDFVKNCFTVNQRWCHVENYYEANSKSDVAAIYYNSRSSFIVDAFNWENNMLNKADIQLYAIDDKWESIAKDYPEIPFE